MKKIIFIVIIAGLIIGYFYWKNDSAEPKIVPTTNNTTSTGQPDPSEATFTFNDGPVTLSGGKNEKTAAGSNFTEETVLLDKFGYGDLNGDGKEDVVLLLARFGGGSGTFIYLAAYVSGPVTYRGSEVAFIGDRIVPQSVSINNGVVNVLYLDRQEGEAFSVEPTVPSSKQFVYLDGEFQER